MPVDSVWQLEKTLMSHLGTAAPFNLNSEIIYKLCYFFYDFLHFFEFLT